MSEDQYSEVERQDLEILPGTPYSRYAVPIEYMPSRDFWPRWGYSKPRQTVLNAWFTEHVAEYRALISEMRAMAPNLENVARYFSEDNLPNPAWGGVPIAPFDSLALYTIVRKFAPKTYLEIGSGTTTCFARRAINDGNLDTKIISIDPQPRAEIDSICDQVIREGLESCDFSIFESLQENDILFFDGSHRSFMNSDVTVFMVDILPMIKPGVIVHVHDINLPWDYPDSFKSWYWNEQYMLAVYMIGQKRRIQPLFPTTFVCRDKHFEDLHQPPMLDLDELNDGWSGGGSMWFRHTG